MVFQVSEAPPERLERLLEAFGELLELSWDLLEPLGALGTLLERSWRALGELLEPSWTLLAPSWTLPEPQDPPD